MTDVQKAAAFFPTISTEVAEDLRRTGTRLHDTLLAGIANLYRDMQQPPIRIDWPEPIPEIGRVERRALRFWSDLDEWKSRVRSAWDVLRYGEPEYYED